VREDRTILTGELHPALRREPFERRRAMGRMEGVSTAGASLGLRLVCAYVRRKLAKLAGRAALPEPIRVTAHHPRLLRATAHMEMGQEAARAVPQRLKLLASVQAARLVGCPF
jgi:4-carboxymuconolactone decarboxylase